MMDFDTDKFHVICDALGSERDPDAAVKAALVAKHKISRWEQFKRHLKGTGKLAIEMLKEVMTDDELDDLLSNFIKRKA